MFYVFYSFLQFPNHCVVCSFFWPSCHLHSRRVSRWIFLLTFLVICGIHALFWLYSVASCWQIIFCLRLFQIVNRIIGFEVLTAVVMKSSIFCDITPCSPLKVNLRFWGISSLHIPGRKKKPPWNSSACYLLHTGYFLGLFFDPENEDMFLRSVSWISMDYTPIYLHPSPTLFFLRPSHVLI
jgi:hypothetical protein